MVDEDCIKLIGKRSTWFFSDCVCGSPGTIITGSESMVAAVSIPTPKTVIVFYPPVPTTLLRLWSSPQTFHELWIGQPFFSILPIHTPLHMGRTREEFQRLLIPSRLNETKNFNPTIIDSQFPKKNHDKQKIQDSQPYLCTSKLYPQKILVSLKIG